jgi:hypothetical protein
VGKRSRQRARQGAGREPALEAPTTDYTDADGNVLRLRGALTPAARAQYAETLRGGLHRDDALARAAEMLFERLAVSWTIAGITTEKQKELLMRLRVATAAERAFVRDSLRAHLSENFPELEAP